MPTNNILTVRLPEEEIAQLDALAALQKRPRSQIVQDAIREALKLDVQLRAQRFAHMKTRLAPAIAEQSELLERHSVADEHRRF